MITTRDGGEGNSNDPNIILTRAVRQNRKELSSRVAQLLASTDMSNKNDGLDVQDQIRELEEAYMSVAREEAAHAFNELAQRNLVRRIQFPQAELGISFVLARFELLENEEKNEFEKVSRESDSALSRRLIVVEKTYENRGGAVGHQFLCPTDELLGIQIRGDSDIIRASDFDLVVDPSVEDFAKLLQRLRDAPRPLTLAFALGPQREEARRAMLAADRRAAKKAQAKRNEAIRRMAQRTLSPVSSRNDPIQTKEEAERQRRKQLEEDNALRRRQQEEEILRKKKVEDAFRYKLEQEEERHRQQVEARQKQVEREEEERRRELEREEKVLRERNEREEARAIEQKAKHLKFQESQRRAREEAERARQELEQERIALEALRKKTQAETIALRKAREEALLENAQKIAIQAVLADAEKAREAAAAAHRERVEAQAIAQRTFESSPKEQMERKLFAEKCEIQREKERSSSLPPLGLSDDNSEMRKKRSSSLTPCIKSAESPLRVEQLETEDECLTAGAPSWTPPPEDYRQVTSTPQEYLGRISPLRALEESLNELRKRVEILERDRGLSQVESELRIALRQVSDRLDSRKRLREPGSTGEKLESEIRILLADVRNRVDQIEAHDYDSIDLPSVDGDRHYFDDALISPAVLPPPPNSPPSHQQMRGIDREPKVNGGQQFSEHSVISPPTPRRNFMQPAAVPPTARAYPRVMDDEIIQERNHFYPPPPRNKVLANSFDTNGSASSYWSSATTVLEPSLADYDAPLFEPVDWEKDAELKQKVEQSDSQDKASVHSQYEARLREIEAKRRTRRLKADAIEAAKVAEEAMLAEGERKKLERGARERSAQRRAEAKRIAEIKERERLARERLALEKDRIEASRAVALAMAEKERRERIAQQKANAYKAMREMQESRAVAAAQAIKLAEEEREDRIKKIEAAQIGALRECIAQRTAAIAYAISSKNSTQLEFIEWQRELVARARTEERAECARDHKLAIAAIENERAAQIGEIATIRANEKRERIANKAKADDLYERELRRQLSEIRAAEFAALDAQRLAQHEAILAMKNEAHRRLEILNATPARRPLVTSQIMRVTIAAFLQGRDHDLIHRFLKAEGGDIYQKEGKVQHNKFNLIELEALRKEANTLKQQRAQLEKQSFEQYQELQRVQIDLQQARQNLAAQARHEAERHDSEKKQFELDQHSLVKSRVYDKDLVDSLRADLDEARYALALAQKKAAADNAELRTQLKIAREKSSPAKYIDEIARLRAELDSAQAAVATISESAEKEISLLRVELGTVRKSLQKKEETFENTHALAFDAAEQKQEILHLRAVLEQRDEEATSLNQVNEQLRSQLEETRATIIQNNSKNAEQEDIRSELEKTRAELELVSNFKYDSQEIEKQLRSELEETQIKLQALENNKEKSTKEEERLRSELEKARANLSAETTTIPNKAIERALEAARKEHALEMSAARDAFNAAQRASADEIARLRLEVKAKKSLRGGTSTLRSESEDEDEDLRIGTEIQAEVKRAKSALAETQKKADESIAMLRTELDESQDIIQTQKKQHAQLADEIEFLKKELAKEKALSSSLESPSSVSNPPIDSYSMAATVNTAARSVADAERRIAIAERQKNQKADEILAMHAIIAAQKERYRAALITSKNHLAKARSDLSLTQAQMREKVEGKNEIEDQGGLTEELIATKLELAATKMELDQMQLEHSQERAATKQLYAQQSAQRRAAAKSSPKIATNKQVKKKRFS